ncbi:hypothetical protein AAFF_G00166820 [Aldrovandia affinis]|uniref:Uncharacterized protein n=1 Tax=Aldrovandia affinis TaxID=143900 RepID=A0AAD7RMD8_9TELE|nr:hypothetical protein AAFF_G00166820 [Aldrovandia affinis]
MRGVKSVVAVVTAASLGGQGRRGEPQNRASALDSRSSIDPNRDPGGHTDSVTDIALVPLTLPLRTQARAGRRERARGAGARQPHSRVSGQDSLTARRRSATDTGKERAGTTGVERHAEFKRAALRNGPVRTDRASTSNGP